jgi:hypothetical protein
LAYVTSCVLDGVAATVWVSLARARAMLLPWAEPAKVRGAPRGRHPLMIEVWRVSAGRMEGALGDQDWWGQGAGVPGAGFVGSLFRMWNEGTAALLGAYHEVALTVPARLRGDTTGQTHAFVAGMYTDSPVARWGDLTMECGYRKRLARIAASLPESCTVLRSDGRPLISIEGRAVPGTLASKVSRLAEARTSWPLLGGLDDGRYAVSSLERSYATPVTSLEARVDCAPGFLADLPALQSEVPGLASDHGWGAFAFRQVSAKLTYPGHGWPPPQRPRRTAARASGRAASPRPR